MPVDRPVGGVRRAVTSAPDAARQQ